MSPPSDRRASGSSRGKRAAERPASRRGFGGRSAQSERQAGDTAQAAYVPTQEPAPREPSGSTLALPPEAEPEPAASPRDLRQGPHRAQVACAVVVVVLGLGALVASVLDRGPAWLEGAGAVAVATALSWLLAARTAGRPLVAAVVALGLGLAAVLGGGRILPTGAAVMTCAVGGVYAVMVTVPAVTFLRAVREVLVATVVAVVTALAALGFQPTVSATRFDLVTLVVALALAFAVVHRLGAGLHGLGRRGLIIVVVGAVLLFATLLYAELLRRYGAQDVVSTVLDFVDRTRERIGAFPRPLVVLLGIPALTWGTHLRARRRQGWWVTAFGVAATVPMAAGLAAPGGSLLEAGLRVLYSLVLGLPLGYLLIRLDLALTGTRGRRGRRAEEAGPHRPEPARFAEL
ncbi:MAG: hypothetical protein AVDCRST_MAG32-2512 [uncultured Nocardioides sp.]|uniref:Uncharacterized protein n=1 Tax=uncultured Nocardioides sp. TaxID=198441 RepID=A0A6J4NNR0_9ACTN|nr:MAG: hypothetical protein AVDCRST_MAG32-2512 [uncultured Nocardioides sp.]